MWIWSHFSSCDITIIVYNHNIDHFNVNNNNIDHDDFDYSRKNVFVIPNQLYNFIKDRYVNKPIGQISSNTIEISTLCNPNYTTRKELTCAEIFRSGQCETSNLLQKLRGASQNTNGHWETRLNCPECGCGTIDILDTLNEIAEEGGWTN